MLRIYVRFFVRFIHISHVNNSINRYECQKQLQWFNIKFSSTTLKKHNKKLLSQRWWCRALLFQLLACQQLFHMTNYNSTFCFLYFSQLLLLLLLIIYFPSNIISKMINTNMYFICACECCSHVYRRLGLIDFDYTHADGLTRLIVELPYNKRWNILVFLIRLFW